MKWLSAWVRDLVVVVFFVSATYMLLPENNLRQYARLAAGLVVIAALLTPVLTLMRWDPTDAAWPGAGPGGPTEELIARGGFLADQALRRLTEDGQRRATEHVRSVVEMALGATPHGVEVQWGPGGRIERISVTSGREAGLPPDAEQVARRIAGYFGLERDQVDVGPAGAGEQGGVAW